ncbi:MAG: peptidoglycan-binding protein [Clostridia bacterium]
MGLDVNKVINVASNEIGYLEKASNKNLDNKTANAGSANYTKYGAYFDTNPAQWCDLFVDWCFCHAYGKNTAKILLGGFSAYTPTSAQCFKNMGRWYTSNPKVGDVIFYKNSMRICHTGIVYKVDNTYVYTIEGNTSGGSQVISNGGGCCKKKYLLTNSRIAGYGRPNYDGIMAVAENATTTTKGGNTVNIELPILKSNSVEKGYVKTLQQLLIAYGYDLGSYGADGSFGNKTLAAVKDYQKAHNLSVDGSVGCKTWESILKNAI